MRFLSTYAGVILGIGSLALTGCGSSSGDNASGSATKGGSGNIAGGAGGGAAGGGASGGGASGSGMAGGGAAGAMSEIGIFGDANGQPFSLTEMVVCEPLVPGFMFMEASFANRPTSMQQIDITLFASAPGSLDCETGSSISYAPAYMPTAMSNQSYLATQGIGSCAITLTELPVASGDSLRGTFTASLVPDSGTGPGITISNGRFSAKLQ